ncbi:MAG: hypothetical protein CMB99_14845 [Flavobacteriaceae bacterium]|nr:hypothetical protein [Flavobacteriaceae bacterium]|tara:strand:+ start:261893 stop:262426 length:534 start_codon:yes stop_codon:yes gene_type:complete
MKKIVLLIAFFVSTLTISAQGTFDALEDEDGVDVVVVTKDAFELISKFKNVNIEDNDAMKTFQMIQELNEFKMFSSDNIDVANKMEVMVNTAIKKNKLTELMRVKEDDSRIKIYVKATSNKDYVSEVLMFIKGIDKKTKGMSEAVVISLTGNIDINKMSDLADSFTRKSGVKVTKTN